MNIVGMGMPSFAYIDPTYAGGSTGADLWTWAVNNVLTDGKMRALFTRLFGIGMIHAYFLWFGDILVCYAVAGLFIFPFRKLGARWLIGIGVAILVALLTTTVLAAG